MEKNKLDNSFNPKRRILLKTGLLGALALGNTALGQITSHFSNNVEDIANINHIEESIKYVGRIEIENFKIIFGIHDDYSFRDKVMNIQSELGLKQDGIIGPATLRKIYTKIYSNIKNLPIEIKSRLDLGKTLGNYKNNNPRKLHLSGFGDPLDNNYFYGENAGENILSTHINEKLYVFLKSKGINIDYSDYNGGNSIQIQKIDGGKYFLAMYFNGVLRVLAHTSPGTYSNKSPENQSRKVEGLFEHYISGSFPKRSNSANGGAIMPLSVAFNVGTGIYLHVGKVNGAGRSHGCFRVPPYYQMEIFKALENNGYKNFKIDVGNLY